MTIQTQRLDHEPELATLSRADANWRGAPQTERRGAPHRAGYALDSHVVQRERIDQEVRCRRNHEDMSDFQSVLFRALEDGGE